MWFSSEHSEASQPAPTPLTRQPYLPPLAILAAVTLVGTLTFLGPVVKPVLIAVFLFFMIQPAAQWLIDRGLSSWVSYLSLFFCVFVFGALLVRVTYNNLYDLQTRLPQYEARAIDLLSQIPGLDVEQFRPQSRLPGPVPPATGANARIDSAGQGMASIQPEPQTLPEPTSPAESLPSSLPPDDLPLAGSPAVAATESVPSSPDAPLAPELMPEESLPAAGSESSTVVETSVPEPNSTTPVPDSGSGIVTAEAEHSGRFEFPKVTVVPELPPEEKLESKTIFELFNFTSEAIGHLILGTAVEWLEAGLMVLFYLIFVILDAHRLPNRIRRALPETGEQVVEMGRDINQSITNYMQIKTLVSLGMAITGGMLMALFRLDNWPLWALLMFLFNYITYVGSLGALVPPILIAFLQFDNLLSAIVLVVLLGANRFFWIDYVEIRYAGKRLSINAVLLLMSLAYWGRYWGVTGLVLAVPMLTALKIALEKFPSTRNWAMLISED